MCVFAIVDADSLPVLATRNGVGDELFLDWIRRRHGILAISDAGKYFNEIRKNRAVMEPILRYQQAGHIRKFSSEQLAESQEQLVQKPIQSNDSHILSLALASKARVLCSNDGDLRDDFKNKDILPVTGKRPRLLYPREGSRRQRRGFLNRQRCVDGQ